MPKQKVDVLRGSSLSVYVYSATTKKWKHLNGPTVSGSHKYPSRFAKVDSQTKKKTRTAKSKQQHNGIRTSNQGNGSVTIERYQTKRSIRAVAVRLWVIFSNIWSN